MSLETEGRLRFEKRRDLPGLWTQCPDCKKMVTKSRVRDKANVCPECNFHFEISSHERIKLLLDPDSFEEMFIEIESDDPLEFVGKRSYQERLKSAQEKTGLREACAVGRGRINGVDLIFGASDSRFLRGSMGSVVGEKICRGVEIATREKLPFIFVSGSGGGARMDEGILSLMQMAKTSAAIANFHKSGGFFISILTNPTMGGAMASFAALGDIVIAEPKALVGFAGPKVVQETIKSPLPDNFQTAEFFLERGFIDMVLSRHMLRPMIIRILSYVA